MDLKTVHIQGAYVKNEHDFSYKTFDDFNELPKSQNIVYLARCHSWKSSDIYGYPLNDCGMVRNGGLVQWAEKTCGTRHPLSGMVCRVALANDEVLWQWRTGSVLVYRFETLTEAESFYKLLFGDNVEILRQNANGLLVGSKVRFKKQFEITNPIGKLTDSFGYFTSPKWMIPEGYEARVYDVSQDGAHFMVTGVDGYDLIRVPNSSGAKMFLSVGWIPIEVVYVVKEMCI